MKKYSFIVFIIVVFMISLSVMNCRQDAGQQKALENIQQRISGKWQLVGYEYDVETVPESAIVPDSYIEFTSEGIYNHYQTDTICKLAYRIDSEFLYAVGDKCPPNREDLVFHSRFHIYKYSIDKDSLKLTHVFGILPKTIQRSMTLVYRRIQ
ncbi:MAG: hypothetical protein LBT83_03135 [Tannerella sp.]|jgi:hypothetical protein|nr:hypothetical protein [Tannerella sp.]